MQLQLKPYNKSEYPLKAILVRETSVQLAVKALQEMGLDWNALSVYPVPGSVSNSIFGFLAITQEVVKASQAGKHELCQQVTAHFFIAERSKLYPAISDREIGQLFPSSIWLMHPIVGLAELNEQLTVQDLLMPPLIHTTAWMKPADGVFIPAEIRSVQVASISPEDVLKNLQENIFPVTEKMKDERLNTWEKIRLGIYRSLSKKTGDNQREPGNLAKGIKSLLSKVLPQKTESLAKQLQQDIDNLEKRNRKEVDKLLDMLKKNPSEALKYAIPLDDNGSERGGGNGLLKLSRRWGDFSLFGQQQNLGSGSVDLGDHYHILQAEYRTTAEALIEQKEYHRAAFIYMKLLKDHYSAARTLEAGKLYGEAAVVYLKKLNSIKLAAECYEKANMITDAIDLYKELGDDEKVGDLYLSLHKKKEAFNYYEKVISGHIGRKNFFAASSVYRNKMMNMPAAQEALLEGWLSGRDSINCLEHYFNNIGEKDELMSAISNIYYRVDEVNRFNFLQVLAGQYKKKEELRTMIREIAYEIVAAELPANPDVVSELKHFNKKDNELVKDAIRYKLNLKKLPPSGNR